MAASDRVVVHGFASTDGAAAFNHNLACARALRVTNLLTANRIAASQMDTVEHGPTAGPAAQMRSVVLERTPGVSRPTIPQITAAILVGPTTDDCGGTTFRIRWALSRNSDATNGGFIIQQVRFAWDVRDCTGTTVPNPDPRTSPLVYFEAWAVPPGTTVPNATAFTADTDQFFWPDAAPWAGGCTNGRVSISATARYHDGVTTLPPGMAQFNPATFANDLFSSTADPALGGNISRPFTHNLRVHWTCCPCSSSPTAIDAHRP
jgi:hypothetical protein